MSQIPHTALEGGTPPGGRSARRLSAAPTVDLPGPRQQLGVFAQIAADNHSTAAAQMDQLLRALGAAGSAASAISAFSREKTAEMEGPIRGQARLDAMAALPDLQNAIANGEYDQLLDGEGSVEDTIYAALDERLKDAPEFYAESFRQAAVPAVAYQLWAPGSGNSRKRPAPSLTNSTAKPSRGRPVTMRSTAFSTSGTRLGPTGRKPSYLPRASSPPWKPQRGPAMRVVSTSTAPTLAIVFPATLPSLSTSFNRTFAPPAAAVMSSVGVKPTR